MEGESMVKLYGIRGSAPSFAPELMLRHKGIPYRRVNLIPDRHRKRLPAMGFPGPTVPALLVDGRRVQTNRAIARALDDVVPEPRLLPADRTARADVETAERFGDEVFQQAVRRIVLWSLVNDPDSVTPDPAIGALPIPRNAWLRRRLTRKSFKVFGISDAVVRDDFNALPETMDRIEDYMDQGVLNGPDLNAADFEIAPLVAALLGASYAAPDVVDRAAAKLARRVMPSHPRSGFFASGSSAASSMA
jgi:glutathione S-transferase